MLTKEMLLLTAFPMLSKQVIKFSSLALVASKFVKELLEKAEIPRNPMRRSLFLQLKFPFSKQAKFFAKKSNNSKCVSRSF